MASKPDYLYYLLMEVEGKNMNFVFFGTPDFAVGVLEELEKKGLLPSLVVTASDKPAGRGQTFTSPPVKVWAEARKIPVLQPEKMSTTNPPLPPPWHGGRQQWDLFVVAAYGKILPGSVLSIPRCGTLNVHPSLLPRLRGASPIQSAILGEEKTGVTIMLMDERMDHGHIVAQRERIIKDFATNPPKASELEKDLAHFGGELLAEVIPEWLSGKLHPAPQDETQATYCAKIAKEDGLVDFDADSLQNLRKIRAYDEWPGAYFFVKAKDRKIRVKILTAKVEDRKLIVEEVLPEGKKKMLYQDFLRGRYTDAVNARDICGSG